MKLHLAQPVVSKTKFNFDEILEKPEITSFIPDAQFKQMQQVSLAYALYEETNQTSTNIVMGGAKEVHLDGAVYYRVSFSVLGVQPINLYEACQLYCAKCVESFSYKTLNQGDNMIFDSGAKIMCPKCQTQQLESIFMI
jgi:hypothetical protein